jgi:hypothetical protein
LVTKFSLVPVTVSALLCATAAAADSKRHLLWALVTGATAAFLVSIRGNVVLVLPVVVAWLAWRHRPTAAAKAILCFGAGFVAVAGPLALRGSLAADRGREASLWGIHFYIGTAPWGDGGYVVLPHVRDNVFGHVNDARKLAERAAGKRLTPAQVSRYWFWRGIEEIRRHPAAYLALEGRKLQRLLAPDEQDIFGDDYDTYAPRSVILRSASLSFGSVAPLALLGIGFVVARRSRASWCVAFTMAYASSLLIFFVTGRYRLVLVPPLLICAAAGLAALGDLWTARRFPALIVSLATLALLSLTATQARTPDLVRLAIIVGVALVIPAALRLFEAHQRGAAGHAPRVNAIL